MTTKSATGAGWALAGLLGAAGVTHFVAPGFYESIVPHWLPGTARTWVWLSGAAELGCAALLARPITRRAGAAGAVALFVAVFPANVQMAVDWRTMGPLKEAVALARLPLQVPLVMWAWWVWRHSERVQKSLDIVAGGAHSGG
jgi:uncharacterized membrane protein